MHQIAATQARVACNFASRSLVAFLACTQVGDTGAPRPPPPPPQRAFAHCDVRRPLRLQARKRDGCCTKRRSIRAAANDFHCNALDSGVSRHKRTPREKTRRALINENNAALRKGDAFRNIHNALSLARASGSRHRGRSAMTQVRRRRVYLEKKKKKKGGESRVIYNARGRDDLL